VLDGKSNISKAPLGLKIYGLFEQEVVKYIESMAPYPEFVNLGAADGYFPLGMVKSNLAKRSICFEITQKGREAVLRNAKVNQVEDKVVILGKADQNIVSDLAEVKFKPEGSLVLCDIDGGEFDLFSKEFFKAIEGAAVIIELHDRMFMKSVEPRKRIIENMPEGYECIEFRSKPPEWSGIDEIEALSDNDRALVTSEGRDLIGEWLVIAPKIPELK